MQRGGCQSRFFATVRWRCCKTWVLKEKDGGGGGAVYGVGLRVKISGDWRKMRMPEAGWPGSGFKCNRRKGGVRMLLTIRTVQTTVPYSLETSWYRDPDKSDSIAVEV